MKTFITKPVFLLIVMLTVLLITTATAAPTASATTNSSILLLEPLVSYNFNVPGNSEFIYKIRPVFNREISHGFKNKNNTECDFILMYDAGVVPTIGDNYYNATFKHGDGTAIYTKPIQCDWFYKIINLGNKSCSFGVRYFINTATYSRCCHTACKRSSSSGFGSSSGFRFKLGTNSENVAKLSGTLLLLLISSILINYF